MRNVFRMVASALVVVALAGSLVTTSDAQQTGKQAGKQTGKKAGKGAKVEGAVKRVRDAHETAAGAQERVEKLSDQALDLNAQYRNVQRRIGSLKVYNDQLKTLVDNQEAEIDNVRAEFEEVGVVGRQVLPLMHRMIDSLERFIELDAPFLLEERKKRVAFLRDLMNRADVSNAEKYRRVVEAYQIENEYGRTIEAYKDRLDVGGAEKAVEILRVGRVSLVYRTLDGQEYGVWDQKAGAWAPMKSGYERDIVAGLRIAREQAAPNLIRVPVPAPEESK